MPRSAAVVIVGAAAILMAGCGGIPASGPPVPLEDPVDVRDRPPVQSEAVPPEDGATPGEIVRGFLEAMGSYEAGPDGSYRTAADFLLDDATEEWQSHPERQAITVYGGQPVIEVDEDKVVLTLSVQASYDRAAGFQRALSTEDYELDLTKNDDDEWRIANPPRGIVISAGDFDNQFDPYNLYFLDPTREEVVPDPIFLPRAANDSVATRLVQELLRGPSDWLDLAVETAFPEGTELSPASVPATGEPVISLSSDAETGDDVSATNPEQRDQMVEQLARTLGQLPAVSGFSVTTDSLTSDIESVKHDEEPEGSAPERALYGVTDDGVVVIEDETLTQVPGPLADLPGLVEVAVDHSGQNAVVVDAEGTLIWSSLNDNDDVGGELSEGRELSSLTWDVRDLVWALDHGPAPDPDANVEGGDLAEGAASGEAAEQENGEAGIVVVDPATSTVADVAISGPAEGPIERFALSPDGTRIAAVIGGELHLGVIVRSEKTLEAVDVQGLRPARVVSDQVVDVAWNGGEELIVLTQEAGDEDAAGTEANAEPSDDEGEEGEVADLPPSDVHVVDLGTLSAGLPLRVPHAESITATFDDLRAVDTPPAGIQVMTEMQSWADVPDVRSPAYPG